MDNHNMLTDVAFHNLRCLRQYVNSLTDETCITITMDPDTHAENKLECLVERHRAYTPPTHLEIAPIIHFSFNQVFNLIRSRPTDYNKRAQLQVEGIHSLLDTAHCAVYELMDKLPNPEETPILAQYSEDIGLKIDNIYERNVNMSTCRYIFEPLYNVMYYGVYNMFSSLFERRKREVGGRRSEYGRSYDLSDIAPKNYHI